MKNTLLPLLTLTLLASCAKQTFVLNNDKQEMERNYVFFSEKPFDKNKDASSTKTHHFFVSGVAQGKAINPAEICGNITNVAKVESQTTFINGLLSLITFGIYSPREARIYCSVK